MICPRSVVQWNIFLWNRTLFRIFNTKLLRNFLFVSKNWSGRVEKHFTRSLRSVVKYFSTLEKKFPISKRSCNIIYKSLASFLEGLILFLSVNILILFSQKYCSKGNLKLEPYNFTKQSSLIQHSAFSNILLSTIYTTTFNHLQTHTFFYVLPLSTLKKIRKRR